jgi:hypothetical protein
MFCPNCKRLIEFDSYFGRYYCTSCNWRSKKIPREKIRLVRLCSKNEDLKLALEK